MHYHCEIVLPPNTDNIAEAVESVMRPFDESPDEEPEDFDSSDAFWDFYVIGGRWAGTKLIASYDPEKIKEFRQWLADEGVTVSGVQCGKQELRPAEQIPKVDAKWNEMFPPKDGIAAPCPMFQHSNDQYGKRGRGMIKGDICSLADAMKVTCERVIFAGPSYDFEAKDWAGPPGATFMLCDSTWNGVNHMQIKWDGRIGSAFEQFKDKLKHCKDTYRQAVEPQDDWITVTVDYHS